MDNLVPHKYGEFKISQIDYYKQKLRKKIFWLVLYTDKNTKEDFKNIDVVSCSLAGTFRLPPYFQLTISTFRDVCTFNCTLAGSAGDEIIGQQILEQVKSELLAWLTE